MVKQTRARFLVTMGALSLAALAGCSAGAPPDSQFQGTYTAAYTIPGVAESGSFSFSVEQKGKMIGSFTDGSTSKVYAFDGVVKNNGSFTGTVQDGAKSYPTSGLLVTGTSGAATAGTPGGDFKQTRDGVEYRGNFVIGGTITTVTSDYRGIYSGVYNVPGLKISGLNSFTVDSKGTITGSMTRGSETGLLTGVISNTGAFTASIKFSDIIYPLVGTLVKTGDGSSQGNFTITTGGVTYPALFSKSDTVVAGGDSPFQGAYRGTYGIPEKGENGNLSFTVDPSGSLSGFFSQSANLPVGTLVGAFQNDGTFSGTLTYAPGSPAPYDNPRAIVGKIGASKVGGSSAGDFIVTINSVNTAGNFEVTRSSDPNSIYRAAYTDAGLFPVAFDASKVPGGVFTTSDSVNISVDKQGSVIGSLGDHKVDLRVTNDGRISGSVQGNDSRWFPLRGIISKVIWSFTDAQGNEKKVPGIQIDAYVTTSLNANGTAATGAQEYAVAIKATGGDGVTS